MEDIFHNSSVFGLDHDPNRSVLSIFNNSPASRSKTTIPQAMAKQVNTTLKIPLNAVPIAAPKGNQMM